MANSDVTFRKELGTGTVHRDLPDSTGPPTDTDLSFCFDYATIFDVKPADTVGTRTNGNVKCSRTPTGARTSHRNGASAAVVANISFKAAQCAAARDGQCTTDMEK
nr:hypothetical protein [Pseudoxanthomonas yeongjuensis]